LKRSESVNFDEGASKYAHICSKKTAVFDTNDEYELFCKKGLQNIG
jgi:hypothetical protein